MSANRRMFCLAGAGHVGQRGFPAMLCHRQEELAAKYGVELRVSGIAEYGGCCVDRDGLDRGPQPSGGADQNMLSADGTSPPSNSADSAPALSPNSARACT